MHQFVPAWLNCRLLLADLIREGLDDAGFTCTQQAFQRADLWDAARDRQLFTLVKQVQDTGINGDPM
jgi:hypothetical protein